MDTLAEMGSLVKLIGVGGPRSAAISNLAKTIGCHPEDDFRKLQVDHPATYVLLATWRSVSEEDIQMALAAGSVVVALEPPLTAEFTSAVERSSGVYAGTPSSPAKNRSITAVQTHDLATTAVGQLVTIPCFVQSPGWRSAAEPVDLIGPPNLIRFTSHGSLGDGSLFSRLFDAWSVVLLLHELPESIGASLSGPLVQVSDELRNLSGHLVAHARLSNQAAALVMVSDCCAPHYRALHVIADQGQWFVDDLGYQLHDKDGNLLDQSRPRKTKACFTDLIVGHWKQLIERKSNFIQNDPCEVKAVLACCLASALSARTGEPESPRKLLELQHQR